MVNAATALPQEQQHGAISWRGLATGTVNRTAYGRDSGLLYGHVGVDGANSSPAHQLTGAATATAAVESIN